MVEVKKEDKRENWLKRQEDQITYGREMKEWLEQPITQKIIEGMLARQAQLEDRLIVILEDMQKNGNDPEVLDARLKIASIKWFLTTTANTVSRGEEADKRLKEFKEKELKKRKKGGGSVSPETQVSS